jgi:hypothetical protein
LRSRGREGTPGAVFAVAAAWLVSCASPPAEPAAPAHVSLESYLGMPAPAARATGPPRRFDILVDLTESMGRAGADGISRASRASSQASDLLLSLPQGTEITLRAQGHRAEASCALPERLAGPAIPTLRMPLAQQLEGLKPRSEGSLAAALAQTRLELERDEAVQRTSVVLFSDLESRCGGDICAEAEALVEEGARLEIVALGEAPLPACLEEFQASRWNPRRQAPRSATAPPRFVIHANASRGEGLDPTPLARGRAGEGPVDVPAGLITMVVELDPPETIGPFRVEPGGTAHVRLLDYPQADPPTRIWRVEREGEPVGRAFPPPDALSEEVRR